MKLSENEKRALARVYLGGLEALRTASYTCATKTVDSLVRKGLLAGNGATLRGKQLGKQLADSGLV